MWNLSLVYVLGGQYAFMDDNTKADTDKILRNPGYVFGGGLWEHYSCTDYYSNNSAKPHTICSINYAFAYSLNYTNSRFL